MSSTSFRELVERLNQIELSDAASILNESEDTSDLSPYMDEIYDAPVGIRNVLNENEQRRYETSLEEADSDSDIDTTDDVETDEVEDTTPESVKKIAKLLGGEADEIAANTNILTRLVNDGARSLNLLQRNIALDIFLALIPELADKEIPEEEDAVDEPTDNEDQTDFDLDSSFDHDEDTATDNDDTVDDLELPDTETDEVEELAESKKAAAKKPAKKKVKAISKKK